MDLEPRGKQILISHHRLRSIDAAAGVMHLQGNPEETEDAKEGVRPFIEKLMAAHETKVKT